MTRLAIFIALFCAVCGAYFFFAPKGGESKKAAHTTEEEFEKPPAWRAHEQQMEAERRRILSK